MLWLWHTTTVLSRKGCDFHASNSWERLAWTSVPHTCHWATFLSTLIHVTEQIPEMPPPSSQSRRLHETTPVTTVTHASRALHASWYMIIICFCCVLVPIFAPRLTFKFPTWRWEAGDANLRASYLPQEQQYLITRRGLQRLRLLGMSKQGKTGTPPPSIFLTTCWLLTMLEVLLLTLLTRNVPCKDRVRAPQSNSLFAQLVTRFVSWFDQANTWLFVRGTWFCFRPDQDRGCFKSCIKLGCCHWMSLAPETQGWIRSFHGTSGNCARLQSMPSPWSNSSNTGDFHESVPVYSLHIVR